MTTPYWWLSFVGGDGVFRGACTVQAADEVSAVLRASKLKINPHGEVLIVGPLTAKHVRDSRMPINTLLSKDQINEPVSVGELRDQGEDI